MRRLISPVHPIVREINKAEVEAQKKGFRNHLGASVLGGECIRELWYHYRWAHSVEHEAETLRLFQRGHREEPVLVKGLRAMGAKVAEVDPRTGKQFRITDHCETIGGSGDGVVALPTELENELGIKGNGLLEFKTHGDKSFRQFIKFDVRTAKPVHFVQMQIYMYKMNLKWALYMAINKNTDELYVEIVHAIPLVAQQFLRRGQEVVNALEPPRRIREDPSFYKCKFCDYKRICHEGHPPDQNCRTCDNIELILDGDSHEWYCHKWGAAPPNKFMEEGCQDWEPSF